MDVLKDTAKMLKGNPELDGIVLKPVHFYF